MFNNINSNYFWWLFLLPLEKILDSFYLAFYSCQLLCIWYPDTFFSAVFLCCHFATFTPKKRESDMDGSQDEDSCESAAQLFIDTECCYCCTLVAYFLFWFIPREHPIYFCGVYGKNICYVASNVRAVKFTDIVINWFWKDIMALSI